MSHPGPTQIWWTSSLDWWSRPYCFQTLPHYYFFIPHPDMTIKNLVVTLDSSLFPPHSSSANLLGHSFTTQHKSHHLSRLHCIWDPGWGCQNQEAPTPISAAPTPPSPRKPKSQHHPYCCSRESLLLPRPCLPARDRPKHNRKLPCTSLFLPESFPPAVPHTSLLACIGISFLWYLLSL